MANCIQVLAFVSENASEWLSSKDVNEKTKLVFRLVHSNKAIEAPEESSHTYFKPKDKKNVAPSEQLEQQSQPFSYTKERSQRESQYEESQTVERKKAQQHQEPPKFEQETIPQQQSKLAPIKARLQKLIKTGDYSGMAKLLGNTLLNINDIGGQPGFLEMLPALSTGPAMYLVFLDLSKELDKPYLIPFSRDAKIITPFKAYTHSRSHNLPNPICNC